MAEWFHSSQLGYSPTTVDRRTVEYSEHYRELTYSRAQCFSRTLWKNCNNTLFHHTKMQQQGSSCRGFACPGTNPLPLDSILYGRHSKAPFALQGRARTTALCYAWLTACNAKGVLQVYSCQNKSHFKNQLCPTQMVCWYLGMALILSKMSIVFDIE